MTFWQFVFLFISLNFIVHYGRKYIDYRWPPVEPEQKSLEQRFLDGEFASNVPIRDQILDMALECVDENGQIFTLEALSDSKYQLVDIEAARAKLATKNKRLRSEIIVELPV